MAGSRAACVGVAVREDVTGKQPLILVEQWRVKEWFSRPRGGSGDGLGVVTTMLVTRMPSEMSWCRRGLQEVCRQWWWCRGWW